MKYLSLLIGALCWLNVSLALSVNEPAFLKVWDEFKKTFGKTYESYEEELRRLEIFKNNTKLIEQHNSEANEYVPKHTYTLRINDFGDWSQEEFSDLNLGTIFPPPTLKKPYSSYKFKRQSNGQVPTSFDWRTNGFDTPAKDQGTCNSCWAFAAVGALEAQLIIKGQKLSLSEQQLQDCAIKRTERKCRSLGSPDEAFQYIKDNGLSSDALYPYKRGDQTCQSSENAIPPNKVAEVVNVRPTEDDLKEAVATKGPVSVAISASTKIFDVQFHGGGLYKDLCTSGGLNHAMLVVGYGNDNNGDFWWVKNSYGPNWGEKGYVRMARNQNNMCGIASHASYPLVN